MSIEHGRPPERDREPYWREEVSMGELEYQEHRYPLWMRLHRSREQYRERRELVPLEQASGERLYLHGTPYILVPDLRLTVALDDTGNPPNGNGRR